MKKLDFVLTHGTIGITKPSDQEEVIKEAQKGNKPYIYHPNWDMPPIVMYTSDIESFSEVIYLIMEKDENFQMPSVN